MHRRIASDLGPAASVTSRMSDYAESSTAAMLSRCDDSMTLALRSEGSLDLEDIVRLQRAASPTDDILSSVGTTSIAVFSSRKESYGTKPTSGGTSYPLDLRNGKGKGVATYASSLSATHGSGSEAEAGQRDALIGIGDWTGDDPVTARPLKGAARARKRQRANRSSRPKKPVIIIQHQVPGHTSSAEDESLATATITPSHAKGALSCLLVVCRLSYTTAETRYFRRRSVKAHKDRLGLAEEGHVSLRAESDKPVCAPLSRVRVYMLVGLLVAIGLTLALSTFAAHYTAAHHVGKGRMAHTKVIVFTATVAISAFSVLAMVVARRALQEALLAGLLQCLVGFALVVEIGDFL